MLLLRVALLGGIFAASAWGGWAWTVGPSAGEPAPSPGPAPSGAPRGDLDGPRTAAAPAEAPRPAPAPAAGAPLRITFADVAEWELDPGDVQVPASVRALSGKAVDIVGYMIPYGDPDAVEEFVLVRDLGSCCFGQAPQPHHMIECRMEKGKRTLYVPGPVRVRGRFRIEEHRQREMLISLYAMDVADCVEVR